MDLKFVFLVLVTVTLSAAVRPDALKKNTALRFKSFRNLVSSFTMTKKRPSFCNGLDCPKYNVIKTFKDYELRDYAPSQWVTTSLTGISLDEASSEMFQRLFKYISGENEKKAKIPMTAPVITRIIPGQGPACENNFTMSFFVTKTRAPVPKPSASNVKLTSLPKQKVFVRTFPGYANEKKDLANEIALIKSIKNTAAFNQDYFYVAGYDSPFRVLGRHNEIWLVAKESQ